MHATAQKEQFSLAYVHAVASTAGFALVHYVVDDDSIDVGITAKGLVGTVRSPQLNLQLKCTATDDGRGNTLSLSIKRKNYEDLRHTDYHIQRLLVVLRVPALDSDWIAHSAEQMTLKHCAFWSSLSGQPPLPDAQQSVTVSVPRQNVFNVAGLRDIVRRIGAGEALND